MTASTGRLIFIHPSDELYGADRMLLEQVSALGVGPAPEVWLPTDIDHPKLPLCEELIRRGVVVKHLDLPIMRRAYRKPAALAKLAYKTVRLTAALRRAAPETVYCTTSAALLAAPAARLAGVPTVIGHVQEIWSSSDRATLKIPASSYRSLIAISDAVAASLTPKLAARTTVVPNGTPEPAGWTPLQGRTGPLRYVVASRWNGWKGHRTLLAAWDQLAEPGHLVVLGGLPPSGESVDVSAVVAALKHPESVTIVGEVADPSQFLDDADVVLMPSDQPEPFGLIAIEAFARGRPVVASAGGGLLDIVTPGLDGWLFPPGDAAALADLLAGLTRAEVAAAGEQARHSYEQRFTTERFATDWRRAMSR